MRTFKLSEAKTRLRIPELWHHFGFHSEPRTNCHCPWRTDHHPSFSVSRDGCLWHDFATGEGGDAVDFLARATGLGRSAACRKFIEFALGSITQKSCRSPLRGKTRPNFEHLERGNEAEFVQLASLRDLSVEALRIADERGLLRFGILRNHRAWVVTDQDRINAQARRLDGEGWVHLPGEPKAWTLPGSWASWPIGARDAAPFQFIALCEGGPDLLAAFHYIFCEGREMNCSAVAVLGASLKIHAEALPLFSGKCVRAFPHTDQPGREAADRWAAQLKGIVARLDALDFTGLRQQQGLPVEDLNDLCRIGAEEFEGNRELWGVLP